MQGKFDTDAVKSSVNIATVIGSYVELEKDGKEYKGLCPFHSENSPSFHVVPDKKFYHCFGCGAHGDVIDFILEHCGVSFKEACETLGAEKLPDGKPIIPLPKTERFDPYAKYIPEETDKRIKVGVPVDLINPKREDKVWKGARPVSVHAYYTKKEKLIGYVIRLEIDGKKITPQIRYTNFGWTFYSFDEPRSLYGLPTMQRNMGRQCLIVEGEKSADAARRIVGDKINVVSWSGGTNGVSKTDWTPLNGRNIVIIPDRDDPGLKAAKEILSIIKPKSATLVLPPASLPKGWDIADQEWAFDEEFYKWCKKNKVVEFPDKYDDGAEPVATEDIPPQEVQLESATPSAEVIPSGTLEIDVPLQGKHSIDSHLLALKFKNELIYDGNLQEWFKFDKVWREEPVEIVNKMFIDIMDRDYPEGYQTGKIEGNIKMLKMRMAAVSRNVKGFKSDNWLVDKHLLPMDNGILDMSTKILHPHDPERYMNWMIPHKWEAGMPYPNIINFLNSLARDNSHAVQVLLCFLAAVLRGMSDCQKFLEIIGTPGTGKSTFIKLACELVGNENLATTTMDLLQNNNFETANLYGKRLTIITDADKYGGSVEVFKSATGQDPLRLERKHMQAGQSFVYQGMIIVAANQPVQYKDQSTAMMRRRVPIHIDHRIDKSKTDKHLLSKLKKELPGLIHDLVNMPQDYIEGILDDRDGYRTDSINRSLVETNPAAEWIDDRIVVDEEVLTRIGSLKRKGGEIVDYDCLLYPNFVEWCEGHKQFGTALNTFRRTIMELLQQQDIQCEFVRRSDGSYIKGVRLRDDLEDKHIPTILTGKQLD